MLHTDFCINLTQFFYQFLETETSDRTREGFDKLLSNLGFSLYPFSFFLFSPFNQTLHTECPTKYDSL